ncbi:MAG TPA: hypothetical protein VGK38_13635, partial [Prolixibacteraceae bacterium]
EILNLCNIQEQAIWTSEVHRKYMELSNGENTECMFWPIRDVYILPRSFRALAIARKRRWFDESVDLEAEIKTYSDGFKAGYSKLQTKFKDNPVYYHTSVFSAAVGGTLYFGIYPCTGLKLGTLKPFEWFKLGELLGREYCAWCIVLENQDKFEPLFKDYVESLTITRLNPSLQQPKESILKKPDHSILLKSLSRYVAEINANEFTNIIEKHSKTFGTPKAHWIGIPADAHRFAVYFKITLPEWNNCFYMDKGRKLKHNDKNETTSAIIDILKQYLVN